MKQWSSSQVADMISFFLKDDSHRDAFVKNNIDGIAIFQVNRGFLGQECGIKDRNHQTKILTGIRRLKVNQTKYDKERKKG